MNKIARIIFTLVFSLSCMAIFQISYAKDSSGLADKNKDTAVSKKPVKKKKDRYRYPRVIGQITPGFFRMIVKDEYLYIALRENIIRINVQGGTPENIISVGDRLRGFALDDEYIYFTVKNRHEINKIKLSGGEPAIFADMKNVDTLIKTLYDLAVDEEHVYCVQGMNLLRISKAGTKVVSLADQNTLSGEPIWLDAEYIYWGNGFKIFMREKDRDIAKVYEFKGSILNNSMAGNSKAFYYANNETTKNDRIMEIRFGEKKYVGYEIPALKKSLGSSIRRNSISCDAEQVYVAANSGVWYMKTGGDTFKVVEDTKNLDCQGIANDDQYIYFTIKRNVYKMTKPKYDE